MTHYVITHRISLLVALALMVAGVSMRSLGLDLDFWGDEAWWATRLNNEPVTNFMFRPVAYMWLCKQLALLGGNDLWLRLPSYVASIGTLLCLYLASGQLYRYRLSALVVLAIAVVHPKLIVFAKEFKPYATEIFIHSALLWWALRCVNNGRATRPFIITCLCSIPFCYNIVFLLPCFMWVFGSAQIKQTGAHLAQWLTSYYQSRRLFTVLVISAALVGLLLLVSPWLEGIATRRQFWGSKYDTFPIDLNAAQLVYWYFKKTVALVIEPSQLHGQYTLLKLLFSGLFGCLAALGALALARRKQHQQLLLLLGTLAALMLANVLSVWPYGAFRTNLFLIPSMLLLFGLGLDSLLRPPQLRLTVTCSLLLLTINFVPTNATPIRYKMASDGAPSPQHTEALAIIHNRYQRGDSTRNIIIGDWHSWQPIDYYLHHATGNPIFPALAQQVELIRGPLNNSAKLLQRIDAIRLEASARGQRTRVWVVVTKLKRFGSIEHSAIIRRHRVFKAEVAQHDQQYHPLILELLFDPKLTPL